MRRLLQLQLVLLISAFLFSCEKETTTDNNPVYPLLVKLQAATDSVVQTTKVPGVVALVVDHKRGIDWLYTAGYSNIDEKLPMNGDHIFRIGSNTKTMTGTVLLQLVDEGKIALNDKLSKYYPEYPSADKITISMLLDMKSGYFNYSEDLENFLQVEFSNPSRVWQPQELIDLAFTHDLYFEPGAGMHYSNTNTFILGQLIENITGNSLETEINNRIVKPLGLKNTQFLTRGIELPGSHGRGYEILTEDTYRDATEYYDVSWGWAAGSAYSTPRELQKYVEELVSGEFLSDALQQKRLTENFYGSPDLWGGNMSYGLALMRCGSFFGHGGDLAGYTSSMYHSNEKDCTIVLYFNTQDDYPSALLFLRFLKILYGEDY